MSEEEVTKILEMVMDIDKSFLEMSSKISKLQKHLLNARISQMAEKLNDK